MYLIEKAFSLLYQFAAWGYENFFVQTFSNAILLQK